VRKRIIHQGPHEVPPADQKWLELERLAQVELTSEDTAHPIESALLPGMASGWRAARPGEQTIRVLFDEPQRLRRIRLVFHEEGQERTQEFALRWSADGGRSYRPVVRQQYHFSPPGTTCEVEDYSVNLDGVTVLELNIRPDISGGNLCAALSRLQIA
jgi:hypothetical protein